MEISLLPKNALKIKGKKALLGVNALDKPTQFNGVLLLKPTEEIMPIIENTLMMFGAGDYEVSGIKISGIRGGEEIVYSISIDGIDTLIGSTEALEKAQHKLKEHNIVIVVTSTEIDSAFVTGLSANTVLFYGEKAADVVKQFAKEGVRTESKYQVTAEKLPAEIETILLA